MTDNQRLQAAPLGRPPGFRDPVTLPPFTAERKLREAVLKVAKHNKTSIAATLREATKIGIQAMIRDIKASREE
jgi:hypothetical protein